MNLNKPNCTQFNIKVPLNTFNTLFLKIVLLIFFHKKMKKEIIFPHLVKDDLWKCWSAPTSCPSTDQQMTLFCSSTLAAQWPLLTGARSHVRTRKWFPRGEMSVLQICMQVEPCLLTSLSSLLIPQPVQADGQRTSNWFWWTLLPI